MMCDSSRECFQVINFMLTMIWRNLLIPQYPVTKALISITKEKSEK